MNVAVKRDQWDFWRKSLENKKEPGKHVLPEIHLDRPESGYWRNKLTPIAIWRDAQGNLQCLRGGGRYGKRVEADPVKEWAWAGEPISHQVYVAVCDRGEPWPDLDSTVSDLVAPPPGLGHNNPPVPEDPAEALKEKIDRALEGVSKYEKIEDDEACARAQTLRDLLNKFGLEGEKEEKAVTAPLRAKIQEAIDKWKPIYGPAREGALKIRLAMQAWSDEKDRRAKEAARLAAEEQARLARETQPEGWPEPPPPPAQEPASTAPQPSTKIRGAFGKAANEKKVPTAIVTDWAALFEHFREHADVQAVLSRLAQKAVELGQKPPGVEIELRSRIR